MSTLTSSAPLLARKVASNSRITSGRVASGDAASELNIKSLNFGGMDLACCISTGSWCCPSVDSAIANGDRHRVSGIDALDFEPVKGMSTQWIDDNDFFISDEDVRAMHHQVEGGANGTAHYDGDDASKKGARHERLQNHDSNKDVRDPSANNAGSWSKLHTTTHSSILTQGVQNV